MKNCGGRSRLVGQADHLLALTRVARFEIALGRRPERRRPTSTDFRQLASVQAVATDLDEALSDRQIEGRRAGHAARAPRAAGAASHRRRQESLYARNR